MIGMAGAFPAAGQLYVGGGYLYATGRYPVINKAITAFNASRSQPAYHLPALSELHGPSFSLGLGFGGLSANVDVSLLGSSMEATRQTSTNRYSTTLSVQSTWATLLFGNFPKPESPFSMGIGAGVTYGHLNAVLTTNDPEIGNYNEEEIDQYNTLGISPTVQVFIGLTDFLYLYFRPSYYVDMYDNDSYTIHKVLNPTTYQNSERTDFAGRFSGLQVQLGLLVLFK